MTRAISSPSFKRILHAPFDSSPEASSSRNQYKVSRASLRAMLYLLMKSARLCPACASCTFAPTDVPDLNNCCARIRSERGFESRPRHKRTISKAKLNVLSFMSRGDSASFNFYFFPYAFLLFPFDFAVFLLPFYFCLSSISQRRHHFGREQLDGSHHLLVAQPAEAKHAHQAVRSCRFNHQTRFFDHRFGATDKRCSPFVHSL
jgi:hypothetical protein